MKPRDEIVQELKSLPRPFDAKTAEKAVWLALYDHLHALDATDSTTPSEALVLMNEILRVASIIEGRISGTVFFMKRVLNEEGAVTDTEVAELAPAPVVAAGGTTLAETPPAKRKAKKRA